MIRDVFVYGSVGRTYGRHFQLDVDSPAEALRALIVLRPGLREAVRAGAWRVIVGSPHVRNALPESDLKMRVGSQPIHFVPAQAAAGGGDGKGIGGIVLGVALVAAAVFVPGIGTMAAGLMLATGVSAIAGGIGHMLTDMPKEKPGAESPTEKARVEDRPSFLFTGVTNNTQQGGPVPLVFGRHLVGSIVISAGLNAEDIA